MNNRPKVINKNSQYNSLIGLELADCIYSIVIDRIHQRSSPAVIYTVSQKTPPYFS